MTEPLPPTKTLFEKITYAFVQTFIKPFGNTKRCLSYFGLFLGVFGFNLILIAMPLSFGNTDHTSLLIFYVALFASMGIVFFPLFYIGYATLDGRYWRLALLAVQIAAFVPLFLLRDNLYITGIFCGLISTVFWGMYHIAMVDNTTDKRRSYQVVLGDNLVIISSAFAAWMAVRFAAPDYRSLILIFACFAMFLSNLCQTAVSPYYYDSKIRTFLAKTIVTCRQHQGLMLRIVQRSLLATPDFILPAVLYVMHYSLGAIGGFIVIRTLIQTALSPLIATLIQKRKRNEYLFGLILCVIAWLFFLLAHENRYALMVFIILNFTGLRILGSSITVKLYAIGNYGGLMLNEVFLGISRVSMLAVLIPLLFWKPEAYLLFMLILALALVLLEAVMTIRGKRVLSAELPH